MGLIYGDIPANIYIYSHSIWQAVLSRVTYSINLNTIRSS